MHLFFLVLAWITPAFIAGVLGWNGIWGSGSAFLEYLTPLPFTGGLFHVPSFAFATVVILTLKRWPERPANLVPVVSIAVLLAAQTLQLDLKDLNAWLFTDYAPARTPFKFGDNPFLLFIVTDAFWVALYATAAGYTRLLRLGLLLPLVPAVLIGLSALTYKSGGPEISFGFATVYKSLGNEIAMVFTTSNYDEQLFSDWLKADSTIARPWDTPNAQHTAIWFTHSMQAIKWGDTEDKEAIVGTICLYEEDQSMMTHPGYFDCFAGRVTLSEELNASFTATHTGFGKEVDSWYSMARLCDGITIPEKTVSDIELINLCHGLKRKYPTLFEQIKQQYGEESAQLEFLRSNANLLGINSSER